MTIVSIVTWLWRTIRREERMMVGLLVFWQTLYALSGHPPVS